MFHPWLLLCLLASFAFFDSRALLAADPLYLERPFDEITLDENNMNAKMKVQPLNLPGRKMPAAENRKGDIEIERLDRPGERFAVSWGAITNVKFFEELVLAEAEQHVQFGHYEEAYPYFRFLEAKYPKTAGLKEAVENFLWVQIGAAFKAGRNDEALALLVELAGRNPQRKGLSTAYERVTVELVKARMASANYRAARRLLRNLGERFPETKATSIAEYETMLQSKAGELLAQAKTDLAAGKMREAHIAASQALAIWPAVPEGQKLAGEIHGKHPLVSVGVTMPLAALPLAPPHDWAALRASRLVGRSLAEPAEVEGKPAYVSPFGEISRPKENFRQLVLKLRPELRWGQPARSFTGNDVARCLLAMAEPKSPAFSAAWADVFAGASIRGEEVLIDFRSSQARPEAWLHLIPWTEGGDKNGALRCGPYQVQSQTPQQVSFVRQGDYFAAQPTQPAEIVERTFADSTAALQALRRGDVNIVDRVSPWDLKRLSSSQDYVVEPYSLPSVHLLVPNPHRPLMTSRALRRAILYAIDREGILHRGLLIGQNIPGCEVISGPFPRPVAKEDYFGYAYDAQIEPRPYDPGVAMVLAATAAQEAGSSTSQELTLAHPAEPVARLACASIARQLGSIGLQVQVTEVAAGQSAGSEYDLLYTELLIREPVVDAWRLLGPGGLAGDCSPAMLRALRALEEATTIKEATPKLQAIHRLAAAELPVIPLWQLAEHCAYHRSVEGIGRRPRGLYQDVEKWQVQLRIPAE